MATYKRGTRYGMLSFGRITSSLTLAAFQASPTLTPDSITDIKNRFLYSDECQTNILLIEGDVFKYYLPLTSDNFDVDISGFRIDILDENFQTVSSNVSTVNGVSFGVSGIYYYLSFTVPAIEKDRCVLAIYNQSDSNRLYYLSNYIDFVGASYNVDYPWFEFRNSYNRFGHYWEEVITDDSTFYNQFRLDVNKVDAKFNFEIEQDKEALTGEIIDITNDVDKYIVLETYQYTEEMHEGFAVLVGCDTLFINDQQYVKKSGYDPNTPALNGQTKGRVELFDLDFATANKNMSV